MSFLSLESALVDRLAATLPSAVQVLTAADLAGVAEGSQPTPAVHVVYGGYRVLEANAGFSSIEQTWFAVVTVRNARAVKSGAGARSEADTLLDTVYASLSAYKPANARPLELTNAPKPQTTAGFMYFPLAFKTTLTLRNTGC